MTLAELRFRPTAALRGFAPLAAAALLHAASPACAQNAAPLNSIQTLLDDMRLKNDATLAGVDQNAGWARGPGHVVMGADPRGTATPWWWDVRDRTLKSTQWWQVMTPWIVLFDGTRHAASNTRVEMRPIRAYVRSKATGRWSEVAREAVDGHVYARHLGGKPVRDPDMRRSSDDSRAVLPPRDGLFHGYCCGKTKLEPSDVGAVHVTLEARLVVDDPNRGDDRDRAQLLLQVGADYFPRADTPISAFAPSNYVPGVGMSRAKLVRNEWQAFSFTTVDVGVVEPTGSAMTEAELRASPPPLR